MNPAVLLDLASDPRLIPSLLDRVRKVAQGKPDLSAFDTFLPALARCREVLADDQQYFAAANGEPINIDRQTLLDEVDEAERALTTAVLGK